MLGGTASKADGKPTGPVAMKRVGRGTQRSATGWGALVHQMGGGGGARLRNLVGEGEDRELTRG